MFGHWFIIANQKNVSIYTQVPLKKKFTIVTTLQNKLGGEKRKDLIRGEAGRSMKSGGGGHRYSHGVVLAKKHDPIEEANAQFAKEVVKFLDGERLKKNLQRLSVIAEPRFLGKLRSAMKPALKKVVTEWVSKDLHKVPKLELEKELQQTINA